MKSKFWIGVSIFAFIAASTSWAAALCVSLTDGSAYNQNFDSLANTAGSTTNTLTIRLVHDRKAGAPAPTVNTPSMTAAATPAIRTATALPAQLTVHSAGFAAAL